MVAWQLPDLYPLSFIDTVYLVLEIYEIVRLKYNPKRIVHKSSNLTYLFCGITDVFI